ncbi:MAG: peptidylprolyl isomerase [Lentisphaeria bacterium]|nr:peptidylprolyl isomerase [Lentisphaeria bacterium]
MKMNSFHITKVSFLALTFLFALSLQSFAEDAAGKGKVVSVGEKQEDSVLVSVNGQPVTLLDVLMETNAAEVRLAGMYSGERLYSEVEKLRRQVVEEIIIRKLVYEEYKRRPFPIDRQYIDRLTDQLAVTMGGGTRLGLEKKARQMGISLDILRDKLKEKIAVDVLIMDACDRPVFITPREVYEYYKNNPKDWTEPKKYSLALLLIAKKGNKSADDPVKVCEKLKKEIAQIKKSEDFASLVRTYSDAPGAEQGGNMGDVDEDKLRPEFSAVLNKAVVGDMPGPIETPEGYYFIRVEKIVPEKKIPYEKVSEKIRGHLENAERIKIRRSYGERLKAGAVIKYYF